MRRARSRSILNFKKKMWLMDYVDKEARIGFYAFKKNDGCCYLRLSVFSFHIILSEKKIG